MELVSAAFKAGGYRSYTNYLYRAKERHIELGYMWTAELELYAGRCKRSVLRGLGPGKQSLPLPVERLS
eukprot:599430-Amphidinium_carterae.1